MAHCTCARVMIEVLSGRAPLVERNRIWERGLKERECNLPLSLATSPFSFFPFYFAVAMAGRGSSSRRPRPLSAIAAFSGGCSDLWHSLFFFSMHLVCVRSLQRYFLFLLFPRFCFVCSQNRRWSPAFLFFYACSHFCSLFSAGFVASAELSHSIQFARLAVGPPRGPCWKQLKSFIVFVSFFFYFLLVSVRTVNREGVWLVGSSFLYQAVLSVRTGPHTGRNLPQILTVRRQPLPRLLAFADGKAPDCGRRHPNVFNFYKRKPKRRSSKCVEKTAFKSIPEADEASCLFVR